MNLVPYTITALSRKDIPDEPTNRNIVIGAVVTCQDVNGQNVLMFDDASGAGGDLQKQTNANGQLTVFVEPGEYTFFVNGRSSKVVLSGTTNAQYVSSLSSRSGKTGEIAFLSGDKWNFTSEVLPADGLSSIAAPNGTWLLASVSPVEGPFDLEDQWDEARTNGPLIRRPLYTTKPLSIFVDAAAADGGDGSQESPVNNLADAMSLVPRNVYHKVRVFLRDGVYVGRKNTLRIYNLFINPRGNQSGFRLIGHAPENPWYTDLNPAGVVIGDESTNEGNPFNVVTIAGLTCDADDAYIQGVTVDGWLQNYSVFSIYDCIFKFGKTGVVGAARRSIAGHSGRAKVVRCHFVDTGIAVVAQDLAHYVVQDCTGENVGQAFTAARGSFVGVRGSDNLIENCAERPSVENTSEGRINGVYLSPSNFKVGLDQDNVYFQLRSRSAEVAEGYIGTMSATNPNDPGENQYHIFMSPDSGAIQARVNYNGEVRRLTLSQFENQIGRTMNIAFDTALTAAGQYSNQILFGRIGTSSVPFFVRWDANSTAAPDNVTVWQPSGAVTGRWLRMNQRLVRDVASVTELRATPGIFNGQQVSLTSYHAGLNKGGGVLVWDADSTAPDDGFLCFAVAGVATGRWIRQNKNNIFSVYDAGCHESLADNKLNITACLNNAPASSTVKGSAGLLYVSDSVVVDRGDITTDGLKLTGDIPGNQTPYIQFNGSTGDVYFFDSDINSNSYKINIPGLQLSVDDYVWLESNEVLWSLTNTAGELAKIKSISGDEVTFYRPLFFSYSVSQNARVTKVNMLRNIKNKRTKIIGVLGVNQKQGIRYRFCSSVTTEDAETYDLQYNHIRHNTCSEARVVRGLGARTGERVGLNYGISFSFSCYNCMVEGYTGFSMRNVVATGGNRGVNRFIKVVRNFCYSCVSHAVDAHGSTAEMEISYNDIEIGDETDSNAEGIGYSGFSLKAHGNNIRNATRHGIMHTPSVDSHQLVMDSDIKSNVVTTKNLQASTGYGILVSCNNIGRIRSISIQGNDTEGFTGSIRVSLINTDVEKLVVSGNTGDSLSRGVYIQGTGTGKVLSLVCSSNIMKVVLNTLQNYYFQSSSMEGGRMRSISFASNVALGGLVGARFLRCDKVRTDGANVFDGVASTQIDAQDSTDVIIRED